MDRSLDGLPDTMPVVAGIATASGQARLIRVHSRSGGPRVHGILLPGDPRSDAMMIEGMPSVEEPPRDGEVPAFSAGIQSFLLGGKDVQFDIDLLDLDRRPPFQQRVLLAESGIPRGGYVSTYGRIARRLGGVPGAARAVGNALARNPFPLAIPCRRALRSDGAMGGFQGGLEMKRRLLEMEGGTGFREDGRVLMDHVWY